MCRVSIMFCEFICFTHSHTLHLLFFQLPSPPAAWPSPPLTCSSSQSSNGPSGGYTYSLPSTPVVGHRDQGGGSIASRSLKNIPRRPSLFKVSWWWLSKAFVSSHLHFISLQLHLWTPCCSIQPVFCYLVCFRTGTRTRGLLMQKETWVGCAVFPSNRSILKPFADCCGT